MQIVPRSLQKNPVIIYSQRPPSIRWDTFCGLNILLKMCDAKPHFAQKLNHFIDLQSFPKKFHSQIITIVATDTSRVGCIAGVIQLYIRRDSSAMVTTLLCKDESKRRYKQLGLHLLRKACLYASDSNDINCVRIWTSAANKKLRSFYEQNGWLISNFANKFSIEYQFGTEFDT